MATRLRERRGISELSQAELADFVGVSVKTLSRYEAGLREPRMSDLVRLAERLNCSVEDLVENPTLPRESRPGDRKRKTGEEPVKRDRHKLHKTA